MRGLDAEPMVTARQVRAFWDAHPCGSTLSDAADRRRYFDEIEAARYRIEPHVPRVARFEDFRGRAVLEVGCGIGTDGLQFARAGARWIGVDLSPVSAATAADRLALHIPGGRAVAAADAERLPFVDGAFDHVYSFGVIHHSPNTERIVAEIRRVLRPGGTFCVMIYNRSSINYRVEIMVVRRLLRWSLYPAVMPRLLGRLLGLDTAKLEGHRASLLQRPRPTREEWISMNTDGPDCPLAKVYDRREALALFDAFDDVCTEVWHFDRDHWPGLRRVMGDRTAERIGRRWGWHRIVYGRRPVEDVPRHGERTA